MTEAYFAKVAVQNLAKQNEGELIYKWLTLPVSEEDFDEALKEIGVDEQLHNEFTFADFDTNIPCLSSHFLNTSNVYALNEAVEAFENCQPITTDIPVGKTLTAVTTENYNALLTLARELSVEDVISNILPLEQIEQQKMYPTHPTGLPDLLKMKSYLKNIHVDTVFVRTDGYMGIHHFGLNEMKDTEEEVITEYFKTL